MAITNKDWTGTSASKFRIIGATGHADHEREKNDYYATEPKATELLCDIESFEGSIWECACGEGHIAKVLKEKGYEVISSDLVDRGYGDVMDFLASDTKFDGNIVTNPPYKYALEFVQKALNIIPDGKKVAMFLKLTFLEGKARKDFFKKNPPKTVWVSSSRLQCGMNGNFEGTSATAYAWFIWEKGYKDDTRIKWFN
ncbi:MAG: class I SAM-dependent methyltransferase [Paludibacteraceae bacterium]|nr:class I SAM-dependent methyltransferase [Paludibacteraceae bacterium]